ncbi:MAG: PRC-barrel domain-containing protein [Candidatus Aenigmarchaeota archaeon]|nr:PRC-barrel domain-containing protein [Candidatus Aenigmarchaeota archaeon]
MVVNEKEINTIVGLDAFTDKGFYCGKVSDVELDLSKFRVRTIVIDAAKGSYLASVVGSKKGVKVPFQMVHAVNDIVIIKHIKHSVPDDMPEDDEE